MKKTLSLVTIIALALTLLVSPISTSAATDPATGKGNAKKSTTSSAPLYGRFVVASANIDVALYSSAAQAVCDAVDSACYYNHNGMVIADHNYQAFKTLTSVQVGDIATITRVDGTVVTLQCVEAFDGHNTSTGLTDWNEVSVLGKHDYLSYTCLDSCYNIRICQWDTVSDTAIVNNTTTTAPTKTKTKGNGNNKKNK